MLTIIQEPINATPEGILRVRELPQDWTEAEYLRYWPHMKQRERERYTTFEAGNLITTAGLYAINQYLGSASSIAGFALYFAVSTGPLNDVHADDLHLATEVFRKAPALATIVGNQSDVSTFFSAVEGNYTYADAGLFGAGATGAMNSGQLNTHVLFPYPKVDTSPVSFDYLLIRN